MTPFVGDQHQGQSARLVRTFTRLTTPDRKFRPLALDEQDFGGVLAQFVDSEGAHCSVGAEAA